MQSIKVISKGVRPNGQGTAQVIVQEEGMKPRTLHVRQVGPHSNVFKTGHMVEKQDENGDVVLAEVVTNLFDLEGRSPQIATPSRPSNPLKGVGFGGKKKSREERDAEKADRKPRGGGGGKGKDD